MPAFWKNVTFILKCLICWGILALLSPVIVFVLGVLIFWKFIVVHLLARIALGNRCERMDSFDCILALDDFWEKPLRSVGQLIILEGPFDMDQVINYS